MSENEMTDITLPENLVGIIGDKAIAEGVASMISFRCDHTPERINMILFAIMAELHNHLDDYDLPKSLKHLDELIVSAKQFSDAINMAEAAEATKQ